MLIGIVIPCRNEAPYIEECLRAIYNCELPIGYTISVSVVDGMSDDGTRDIVNNLKAEMHGLQLVDNVQQLTPFAFNLGIYATPNADFIQIVGARHILSSNYLKNCIEKLNSDKETWCVGGRIINEFTSETSAIISKAMSTSFGMGLGNFRTLKQSGYTDTVTSPMYPMQVFEKIGYFDERLTRNQDDDFNFRVEQNGGKIYYDHEISLKYYVRGTYKGLWRQFFQYGYWKVFVNKKHKAVTTMRQLVPPLFVLYIMLLPFTYLNLCFGLIATIPLILYIILAKTIAWKEKSSFSEFIGLIKTFPILHISYGLGYLKGIVHFILLNKQPSSKEQRLSR